MVAISLISGHDLELGAEKFVQQGRHRVDERAFRAGAGGDLRPPRVFDRAHPGGMPGHHGAVGGGHDRADPMELAHVVANRRHHDQLDRHQRVRNHADRGAVLGGDRLQEIGHEDAAAADHVLRHHGGIAGQVRSEVARNQPRIAVIGAADIHPDQQVDDLAPVEVRDRICGCLAQGEKVRRGYDKDGNPKSGGEIGKPVSWTFDHRRNLLADMVRRKLDRPPGARFPHMHRPRFECYDHQGHGN
jgi:hypothetical protein